MARRDIGTDDPRVRVRPGKSKRPRTKNRPSYEGAHLGRVVAIHRGRFAVVLEDEANEPAAQEPAAEREVAREVMAVKARLLGRKSIVVGDLVRLEGDLSGRKDTLGRIVLIEPRTTELRRVLEEEDGGAEKGNAGKSNPVKNSTGKNGAGIGTAVASGAEKLIVANATQMLVVVAAQNPEPRPGMIDRCLVAALAAGVRPGVCITKTDLDAAAALRQLYEAVGVRVFSLSLAPTGAQPVSVQPDFVALQQWLAGEATVLVGHSGVGKSTLINALVPGVQRKTGDVNQVTGRGRHTSTSAVALRAQVPPVGDFATAVGAEAAQSTWVIDTPGVRSFGLGHLNGEQILAGFPELAELARQCPRGCTHQDSAPDCYLDQVRHTPARLDSLRKLLPSK